MFPTQESPEMFKEVLFLFLKDAYGIPFWTINNCWWDANVQLFRVMHNLEWSLGGTDVLISKSLLFLTIHLKGLEQMAREVHGLNTTLKDGREKYIDKYNVDYGWWKIQPYYIIFLFNAIVDLGK